MSFENRDWAREPEPREWSPRRVSPILVLVAITTFAFLVQQAVANGNAAAGEFIEDHLVLRTRGVLGGEIWQPLTYLLLHGSLSHLFFNMFGLYAFGSILRDRVSDRTFWITYLVGGLAGAAACILWDLLVPESRGAGVVGASGAITAVMVAAAFRAPNAPIGLFLMPATIPLWLLGTVYVAIDLIGAIQGGRDGIAVQAHLGGAASAAALWFLARNRPTAPRASFRGRIDEWDRLEPPPAPREAAPDEARVEARGVALLERIHASGIGSLSDEEREFLRRASERYRGRGPR